MSSMRVKVRNNKGKHEVVVITKDPMNGKYKYKRMGIFENKLEAEVVKFETEKKINNGEDVLSKKNKKNITLNDCIESSFEKEEMRGNKVSSNTFLSYKNIYKNHVKDDIGRNYISMITTGDIQDLLDEKAKKYGCGLVSQIKTIIKKGVQYALYRGYINNDVTNGLIVWGKESKTSAETNCLSINQISDILKDTEDEELSLKIKIGLSIGIRESEVLALSWDNIDFENNEIRICQIVTKKDGEHIIQKFTKNKKDLVVKMPKLLSEELKKYKIKWNKEMLSKVGINKHNLLFYRKGFKPIPVATLSNQFKRYMESKGINNVTFHGLRHSYASILFYKGMDLKDVGQMLNHKSKYCTDRVYVHLLDETKSQAMNVMNEILL